jgi:hypothetical protein
MIRSLLMGLQVLTKIKQSIKSHSDCPDCKIKGGYPMSKMESLSHDVKSLEQFENVHLVEPIRPTAK